MSTVPKPQLEKPVKQYLPAVDLSYSQEHRFKNLYNVVEGWQFQGWPCLEQLACVKQVGREGQLGVIEI